MQIAAAPRPNLSIPSNLSVGPQDETKKKWTVLLYSAADNNLYVDMVDDVCELEHVGSDANTNIAVQIDHGKQVPKARGAQRHFLEKHSDSLHAIQSPVVEELGQINMGDANVLSKSIQWAMKAYPSEHFMLVISDHGNSWKGCASDDSNRGWMATPSIKAALQDARKATGQKIDVVGFDCCLMANTEVAYELRNEAEYMVASEMTEGAAGWPYAPIFGADTLQQIQQTIATRLDVSPRDLATSIVNKTQDSPVIHTLSAIDLSKMDELKEPMIEFRKAMEETPTTQASLREIWKNCTRFFGYRDAGDFAYWLANDDRITDENLKEKARAVEKALTAPVIAEQHAPQHDGATGLTLQVHRSTDLSYDNLAFEKDIHWSGAQKRVGGIDDPKGPMELSGDEPNLHVQARPH